jgi:hypothetical protein
MSSLGSTWDQVEINFPVGDSISRQACPAGLPGRLARQACPAVMPGSLARQSIWADWIRYINWTHLCCNFRRHFFVFLVFKTRTNWSYQLGKVLKRQKDKKYRHEELALHFGHFGSHFCHFCQHTVL